MNPATRSPVPAAILGLLLITGCGSEPSARLELPHPSLEGMEPAVAQALEAQRRQVDALFDSGSSAAGERARAIGLLGQLYQAHRLIEAATACYREAHALDPDSFEWAYYLGVLAAREGQLEESASAFRHAVELRPGDVQALIRLADLEFDRGRIDPAHELYVRAHAVAPEMAASEYGLGRVAAHRRSFREAIDHFDRALVLEPRATVIHYHLGQAYRQLEQLDEAQGHLERSGPVKVSIPDPLMSQVNALVTGSALYLVQGNTALRDGRLSVAAQAFRQAIEVDPDNPKAHQSLATVFTMLRNLEGARDQLQIAAELAPGDAQTRSDLGSALAEMGQDEQALEHLQRAVELDPGLQQAQFNLANTLARLGRFDEAETHYRHLLEIDPENSTARSRLATALAQSGHPERAIPELLRVVEQDPDDHQARLNLGIALAAAGELEQAIDHHQKVLELSPDDVTAAQTHFNLGTLALRRNDRQEALERFRQALEHNEGMAPAHLNLANLLAAAGQLAEAAPHFARAGELAPQDHRARLGEATALLHLERYADALTALEESVRLLPGEIPLVHALARLLAAAPEAALRDGQRSLELTSRALATATIPSFVETQAMALAELGRFDEAVSRQRAVLQRVEELGQNEDAQRVARNLQRYVNGEGCCADPRDVLAGR